MHRGYRLLSSLLLTATLAAPVALMAAASPQDNRNHDNDNRNQENRQGENNKRYYDKGHKDYHTWDSNEANSYQRNQTEHHQKQDFAHFNTRQPRPKCNWCP